MKGFGVTGALLRRFGLTGRVLVKVDREVDPYTHIDHVREEVFDQGQLIVALDKRVLILEDAERRREKSLTESGVLKVIQLHGDHEIARWVKWGIRISVGCIITGMLTGVGWLITWFIKEAIRR
jgi:hypothetical protein